MYRIIQNIYSIPIRTRAECIIAFQYLQCVPNYDSNVIRKVSNNEDIFLEYTLYFTSYLLSNHMLPDVTANEDDLELDTPDTWSPSDQGPTSVACVDSQAW